MTTLTTTAPTTPATLQARVNDLVEYIRAGRILEAMQEFYADDVRMQENNKPPTDGLEANYAREEQFVNYVKRWTSLDVDAVAVDAARGKTLVQVRFSFDAVDGTTQHYDQIAVQTWRNGKVVHERFIYDTATLAVAA